MGGRGSFSNRSPIGLPCISSQWCTTQIQPAHTLMGVHAATPEGAILACIRTCHTCLRMSLVVKRSGMTATSGGSTLLWPSFARRSAPEKEGRSQAARSICSREPLILEMICSSACAVDGSEDRMCRSGGEEAVKIGTGRGRRGLGLALCDNRC